MVALHITKYSQIVLLSLLLISLPSFCADDVVEQEAPKNITFSCNIPGLNAPLQLERTDGAIDKIQLICAAIDHGRLLSKQLKSQQSVQEMVIDHALLAAFRITIGLTSTVCHELGHAICTHYDRYATLQTIIFRWSPANLLLGTLGGNITRSKDAPIDAEKVNDDGQSLEIQCENLISFWSREKNECRNNMIMCAAGPLVGALSVYMLYKRAEYGHPLLSYDLAFREIGINLENLIPLRHVSNYITSLLIARTDKEQTKRKLEQLSEQVHMSDGDQFCKAWKKRKKAQVRIDELNDLYQQAKEQKAIIVQNRSDMLQ